MSKYYILRSKNAFYNKDKGFTVDYDICGLFDDTHKLHDLANKLLARCKAIVGEENVTDETLTSVSYITIEGIHARYELDTTCVTELNEEL